MKNWKIDIKMNDINQYQNSMIIPILQKLGINDVDLGMTIDTNYEDIIQISEITENECCRIVHELTKLHIKTDFKEIKFEDF
jgi:ABC-type microcin C transport system permease subunit YejE